MQSTTIWRKRTSPSSRVWAMRRWGLGELGEWAGSPSLSHTGLFVEQKRIRGEESFLDVSATRENGRKGAGPAPRTSIDSERNVYPSLPQRIAWRVFQISFRIGPYVASPLPVLYKETLLVADRAISTDFIELQVFSLQSPPTSTARRVSPRGRGCPLGSCVQKDRHLYIQEHVDTPVSHRFPRENEDLLQVAALLPSKRAGGSFPSKKSKII